jgi:hypothetical protein
MLDRLVDQEAYVRTSITFAVPALAFGARPRIAELVRRAKTPD